MTLIPRKAGSKVVRTEAATRLLVLLSCLLALSGGTGCKLLRKRLQKPPDAGVTPPLRRAWSLDELAGVCRSNATFDGARAYTRGAPGAKPSKVAVFTRYMDDSKATWLTQRPAALGAIAAAPSEYADVELVACVEMKREGTPGHCNFYDKELLIYTMKHDVRVVEVKTGKEVQHTEFVLEHKTARCPGSYDFPPGSSKIFQGGDYGPKLASELLPLEPDGVKLGSLTAVKLDDVCSGSAVPQAAAYTPSDGARVHIVYFPDEDPVFSRENLPSGMPPLDDLDTDAAAYELVACVVGKHEKKKRSCSFTSGKVLDLYDGVFEVQLHEAKTGKLVETKTFKGTSSGVCPTLYKFYGTTDKLMTKVEPALGKYLAALQGGKKVEDP